MAAWAESVSINRSELAASPATAATMAICRIVLSLLSLSLEGMLLPGSTSTTILSTLDDVSAIPDPADESAPNMT
eukprot:scaffold253044_cov41-Attheya_sp.AAC.4